MRDGALPLPERITVLRVLPDRLLVTIRRGQDRVFSLSLEEAAHLQALLRAELPEVTVRRLDQAAAEAARPGTAAAR